MWTCGWPAPAKINLFLHVTRRRDDGYHELQTLFQFLDFGDALHFRLRDDGRIRRLSRLDAVAAADDLAVRAAHRLQREAGTRLGADIFVSKRIPPGAGLGGGSSDAATVLAALNVLWKARLDTARLAALGLELGADVPVFIHGHAAWAEGVGEVLTPVDPATPWYLVVLPAVTVSTGAVFGAAELTRDTPPITIRDFLAGAGVNACEPVVRARFPAIDAAFEWAVTRGLRPCLSGTGSAVFAACDSEQRAREAYRDLPPDFRGAVARGLNESPLMMCKDVWAVAKR